MALPEDNKPRFATEPNVDSGKITDALSANTFGQNTNTVTCFTAGPAGSLLDSMYAISSDSAQKILHLYIDKGSGDPIPLGAITIPLGSGSNGTALPVDLMSNINGAFLPISNQGKRYIRLEPGWTIKAGVFAALTSAKNIWVNCSGNNFEA